MGPTIRCPGRGAGGPSSGGTADVGKGHDRFCIVDYGVVPEPGYPTVQEPGATILGVVAEDGADRHRVWADRDDGDGSTLGLGACVRPTGAIGEPDPGDDDGSGLQVAVGRRLERLPVEEEGSGLGFDRSDRSDEAMATRSPLDRSEQDRTVLPLGVDEVGRCRGVSTRTVLQPPVPATFRIGPRHDYLDKGGCHVPSVPPPCDGRSAHAPNVHPNGLQVALAARLADLRAMGGGQPRHEHPARAIIQQGCWIYSIHKHTTCKLH